MSTHICVNYKENLPKRAVMDGSLHPHKSKIYKDCVICVARYKL
jgi:hypothetical protein